MTKPAVLGSVEWNRAKWGSPEDWERNGNNWSFHSDFCSQPYDKWQRSVVKAFVEPFLSPGLDVLEIAPGQGRWTEYLVGKCASLTLVDLNKSCIDVCRDRFGSHPEIEFLTNDGRTLPVGDASVDLIWSFGSFVHFDPREVDAYLGEFRRVLRPGGRFVIHHTGWPDETLRFTGLTRHLGRPGRVLQHRLAQGRWRPGGDRVEMSAQRFAAMAEGRGLVVESQTRTWGDDREFGLAFNDVISVGSLPDHRRQQGRARSSSLRGRIIDVAKISRADEEAWRDLGQRALEPNPFYEPDCLIPAARHQTFGQEIQLIVAEDDDGFYGCIPVRHVSRWHKMPYQIVTTQVRRMIYLGTPLVDVQRGTEAATALLRALVNERRVGRSRVLALQELTDGPIATYFRSAASALGLPLFVFESFERGLVRRAEPSGYERAHSPRTFRNLRRKQRNLGKAMGAPVEVVDRGDDPKAIDDYINLEASGYKADAGVAMVTVSGEPEFFREMCERFAAAGRLHLPSLTDGKHTVAMIAWVRGGDTLFQFKWSFDEDYARFSPGLILHTEVMRVFQEETDAILLDSCTWAGNEMINHLYPDRRRITSFFIILGSSWRDQLVIRSFLTLRPAHRWAYEWLYERTHRDDARRGRRAPGDGGVERR